MRNIIMLSMLALMTACASTTQPDHSGDWLGILETPDGNLRVEFQVRPTDNGYSASGISHDQGGQSFPAESVVFEGQAITISFPILDAVYTGELVDGRMEGMLRQMGLEMPLNLELRE